MLKGLVFWSILNLCYGKNRQRLINHQSEFAEIIILINEINSIVEHFC